MKARRKPPAGESWSITVVCDQDVERVFSALANGGKVHVPLGRTFFAARFRVVTDRFGASWFVTVAP